MGNRRPRWPILGCRHLGESDGDHKKLLFVRRYRIADHDLEAVVVRHSLVGLDEEEAPGPGLGDACCPGAFLSPTARLRAGGIGNSGDDENGLTVSDPRSEAALARKRKTPPG